MACSLTQAALLALQRTQSVLLDVEHCCIGNPLGRWSRFHRIGCSSLRTGPARGSLITGHSDRFRAIRATWISAQPSQSLGRLWPARRLRRRLPSVRSEERKQDSKRRPAAPRKRHSAQNQAGTCVGHAVFSHRSIRCYPRCGLRSPRRNGGNRVTSAAEKQSSQTSVYSQT